MANDTEINEPTLNPVESEKPKGHNLKINTIFNAIMMSRTTYLYEKRMSKRSNAFSIEVNAKEAL